VGWEARGASFFLAPPNSRLLGKQFTDSEKKPSAKCGLDSGWAGQPKCKQGGLGGIVRNADSTKHPLQQFVGQPWALGGVRFA